MLISRTQINVRYAETDKMGNVYHANYLTWFEVGRTAMLKECGVPYRDLEAQGYFLPVIEIGMKYLRPSHYDDTLTIISQINERPLLRIRMEYEVRRGEELIATGFTVHTFINKAGEPVRPPPAFAEKLREIFPNAPKAP